MGNKVSVKIKNEIRKRFEDGEDLKELAYEYKVSYGTLRNTSSKENWEKGINAAIRYLKEVEKDIESHIAEREEIVGHYRTLHKSTLAYLIELERKKERPTSKAKEEALKNRVSAHRENYQFAKELYSVMTPNEELDYKMKLAKYEAYKKEVFKDNGDDKKKDIEI
ncbi:hypothetical protein VSU16_03435 [Cetobacterium somerae]|uniref:hypothetical protein n=1 Tax=Cetobacterium somerae TaxID=188913 RepID=UPI002E7C0B12|nr:hypothetical protein [Cetobacterium somerae]WVJ01794.1 hypothetical protein VSU16_03435 [Cetobacterium somerae]